MDLFLAQVISEDEVTYSITPAGYGLIVALAVVSLLILSFFLNTDGKTRLSVKQLTVSALCIGLAFATSNIKFLKLPMGGSITLFSMFFICFVGYLYGPRVSFSAAFAYSLLQMVVDPYIISVPQMLCDYTLAFTALGLSGFFYNKKYGIIKGYIAGVLGRYFFAILSGVIFFASYAPETMSPLLYSICYNGIYLGVEAGLTLFLLAFPEIRHSIGYVKRMANEKNIKREVSLS